VTAPRRLFLLAGAVTGLAAAQEVGPARLRLPGKYQAAPRVAVTPGQLAPRGPAAAPSLSTATGRDAKPPLTLEALLASVRANYPPLLAVLAEQDIADADLLAALGKFDYRVSAGGEFDRLGFYRNELLGATIEQATTWNGLKYFGGYRLGAGSFPSYEGKLQTRANGEFETGIKLPLFRDRAVDQRRADLRRAEIGRAIASLTIQQQQLLVTQLATRRYYSWLAAGQRYYIAKALLDIALQRDQILRDSVAAGQVPEVEVIDNNRAILQRRSALVEAERALQLAAIDLSLFWRDREGQPQLAEISQLPSGFPEVIVFPEEQLARDTALALERRPELQRILGQAQQLRVEQRLFQNQRLPNIDLGVGFYSGLGDQNRVLRGPQELKGSVTFDLPLQRREATGKLAATEARIRQLEQRERFLRDQIVAEVQDAMSAVRAAYERVQFTRDEVNVAKRLEQLERDRFELGDSTLFLVNLREQATADAQIRVVAAEADYFFALASYELAIAKPVP
jgi:outer membrane protein TolC